MKVGELKGGSSEGLMGWTTGVLFYEVMFMRYPNADVCLLSGVLGKDMLLIECYAMGLLEISCRVGRRPS